MHGFIEWVNGFSAGWAEVMWTACWQGGLALVVAAGLCALVARVRATAAAQSWVWRLAAVKFFLCLMAVTPLAIPLLPAPRVEVPEIAPVVPPIISPPAVPVTVSMEMPVVNVPPVEVGPFAIVAEIPAEPVAAREIAAAVPPAASINWKSWLLLAWVAGVYVLGLGLLMDWRETRRLRAASAPIEDENLLVLYHRLACGLSIGRPPALRHSATVETPMLVGLLHPVILLPTSMLESPPRVTSLALAHELAHARRRDLWWNGLFAGLEVMFFFHPLVWMCRRQWCVAQEIACDQLALHATGASPAEYGTMLVDIVAQKRAHRVPSLAMGIAKNTKTLKRRLTAMRTHRPVSSTIRVALMLSVVAAIGLVPWRVVAQQPAAPVAGRTASGAPLPPPPISNVTPPESVVTPSDGGPVSNRETEARLLQAREQVLLLRIQAERARLDAMTPAERAIAVAQNEREAAVAQQRMEQIKAAMQQAEQARDAARLQEAMLRPQDLGGGVNQTIRNDPNLVPTPDVAVPPTGTNRTASGAPLPPPPVTETVRVAPVAGWVPMVVGVTQEPTTRETHALVDMGGGVVKRVRKGDDLGWGGAKAGEITTEGMQVIRGENSPPVFVRVGQNLMGQRADLANIPVDMAIVPGMVSPQSAAAVEAQMRIRREEQRVRDAQAEAQANRTNATAGAAGTDAIPGAARTDELRGNTRAGGNQNNRNEQRAAPRVASGFSVTGVITAPTVEIRASMEGVLQSVQAVAGHAVKKGDVLYRVQSRELETRMEIDKARVKLAEAKLVKAEILYRSALEANAGAAMASTEQDIRLAKVEVEATQRVLEGDLRAVDAANIRAPFDGILTLVSPEPVIGQFVQPGTILAKVVNPAELSVAFHIDRNGLSLIKTGTKVKVWLSPTESFNGEVNYVAPDFDTATGTVTVRARVLDRSENLKPGGTVTVKLPE